MIVPSFPSILTSDGEEHEVWDGKSKGPPRKEKFPDKDQVQSRSSFDDSTLTSPGFGFHPCQAVAFLCCCLEDQFSIFLLFVCCWLERDSMTLCNDAHVPL